MIPIRQSPLVIVLCINVLASGCGDEKIQTAPLPPHVRDDRAPNPDHAIFDVVLSDLIHNKEFEVAADDPEQKKKQIVLNETTYWLTRHLVDKDWPGPQKELSLELRADLVRRNPEGKRYSLAHYHPSKPYILVRDLSAAEQDLEFSTAFPDARGYVVPSLPGYSDDGRTAVLHFSFGPLPHGGGGFYVLHRVDDRWEITRRRVFTFS